MYKFFFYLTNKRTIFDVKDFFLLITLLHVSIRKRHLQLVSM